jgi:hypothetical protein
LSDDARRTPRSFAVYVAAVCAFGALLIVLSWRYYPPQWSLQLALVILVAALSEFFSFETANMTFSIAYALAMSAIVLGGPAAAGLVAASSAITLSDVRKRRPPVILAFNFGQLVLAACAGGWAYVLLGGRVLTGSGGSLVPLSASDFPGALYGMVACAVVVSVSNTALISIGIGLYQGQRVRNVFRPAASLLPTEVALAFVGFLMAEILAISIVALPLFLFPLIVARQLYQRYTSLRSAYVDTVRSLIGALEAKDPYTRGHSERVAAYAVALAAQVGLDDRSVQRLEYAALLHDLGKLAVPRQMLLKPGKLTSEEYQTVALHPVTGADMVSRIPPLKDLAELVRLHHERVDGTGYPTGAGASQVPLGARILTVADSYDAMTTTRPYRPAMSHDEAVAELISGAGTQFDQEVVRCFIAGRVGRSHEDAADSLDVVSTVGSAVPAGGE